MDPCCEQPTNLSFMPINKKTSRVPVRQKTFDLTSSNKNSIENESLDALLIDNELIKTNQHENSKETEIEMIFESLENLKTINTLKSDDIENTYNNNDEEESKENKKYPTHIHRHRHLRHHRNYKVKNTQDKKVASNDSEIEDPDSINAPIIKFNLNEPNVPYFNLQDGILNKETSDYDNMDEIENENIKEQNLKRKTSSLRRSLHLHRSTPNLTSISMDNLETRSLNNETNDVTNLVTNNYPSNFELSTDNNQIYNDFERNNLILNNSKMINNNISNSKNNSLEILINNNSNNIKKCLQRFKLIKEGDVHLCKLAHSRNLFSKILSSKILRRWKAHRLVLKDNGIYSTTKSDYMENGIPYHTIIEVSSISRWEPGQKYCLRVATLDCHYLIQTNNVYVRDQWIYSIIWKKHKFKSERVLKSAVRPEIFIKEIKNMIEMSLSTPIEDNEIYQHPLELVSEILQKQNLPKQTHEEVIVSLGPLLEKNQPSPEICDFFSKHCRDSPRSHIVIEMFTPVVQRILKHNGDFARYPRMRLFIQDFLTALMSQNEGLQSVQNFVISMHSSSSQCPFPRVLPNFVSVCLASIHSCFEQRKNFKSENNPPPITLTKQEQEDQLVCHTTMMLTMSKYEDWIVNLAQLLQSVPFPDQALTHEKFIKIFKVVVENFAQDTRCEVHQTLLGIREGKEGWFEIFCPGGISCDDDGELFSIMLKRLIGCCCKKKRFLLSINKLLSQIMILAVREVPCAIETLCAMLDLDGVENPTNKLQIISALQSTQLGLKMYAKVCERQMQLKELQQKGGPRKLTLPSRSTDEDLAKLLLSGAFGNLECLSLAFTNVTSACAEYLIKLPSLRYLNLWSTKFGDEGLELISEHLQRLQVLNLCETPVTDKGLACLASMKQLRKLNLNSTNLSALTFEGLKECLPALQECDIRYTDAW